MICRVESLDDHLTRIESFYEEGRLAKASHEVEVAQVRFPNSVSLLQWKAILAADSGQLKEALAILHQALQEEPGRRSTLREKASVLQGLGRFKDSLEILLNLGPEGDRDAAFHYQLAICLDREGRVIEAVRNFQIAHRLKPSMFFVPSKIKLKTFETLLLKVIVDLPKELREILEDAKIRIENYPRFVDHDPYILLALTREPCLEEGSSSQDVPRILTLFKRNFEVDYPDLRLIEQELYKALEFELISVGGV